MANNYYALILAGGGGTRLWPMSRKTTPKQLLALVDDRTLFKTSIERLDPLFQPDHIYIVTGPTYIEAMRHEAPAIPAENFVIEPYGRNTAPAAALALAMIHKRDRQATIVLLTADHHIGEEQNFRDLLAAGYAVAQDDYIVTLGISPTFPSTGFGYIHQGEKLREVDGHTSYEALGFTEKPNMVTATSFLAAGTYTWNSGMFIWRTDLAMREFERQQPEIYTLLQQLEPHIDTPAYQAELNTVWSKMPDISIDYAIMEGAEKIAVIPADIGWNDVGSWDSLFDVMPLDKFGNCIKGDASDHVILDTRGSMIFSDRMTVTIGVDDIILIDTKDVVMVCHRERAQDVKEVVNHLKSIRRNEYL